MRSKSSQKVLETPKLGGQPGKVINFFADEQENSIDGHRENVVVDDFAAVRQTTKSS